ncbi:sugar phosphate isomerase/epimerase [Faecalicatena acetigenes]|uniref:Sugar phosphate isomerase/epimerase n=1 Tax=Faecalicatena acetigenes TaxID=2981790 RepID=A0ABT2TAJ2_9FIRM|nr:MULTISPECIES: sugar phosphate isomerase/epimerase [Lachnospiraceae]MCU6747299.1 sugar phosphate isomerase/epimerase [Faecalicatena acetigenes]SCH78448.1 putative L-xylulose 5-phosphate 3-epimerase [uncultured Clostridium sp.]
MRLGFLSSIVPELSFEEVIDFAAENGFASVELACWPYGKAARRYAGVTHIDVSSLDDEKVAYIKKYVEDRNIVISGLGYYPNPLSADPETRKVAVEHIKACIIGAKKLGVYVVNTFIGKNRTADNEQNWKEFLEVWPDIIAFADEQGVKIGIENCPMYFKDEWPAGDNLACSPAFWRKMFTAVESDNFGLNYDPSHMAWQRMDYLKPIYEFKDKLFHFHIKDVKFYQEKYDEVGIFAPPLEYHVPKLPGLGDIQWGKVIAALNDVHYKGDVIIEVEDRAYEDTLEDRLGSILLCKQFMNQYVR